MVFNRVEKSAKKLHQDIDLLLNAELVKDRAGGSDIFELRNVLNKRLLAYEERLKQILEGIKEDLDPTRRNVCGDDRCEGFGQRLVYDAVTDSFMCPHWFEYQQEKRKKKEAENQKV